MIIFTLNIASMKASLSHRADNYMRPIETNKDITKNTSLKHFSSDEVFKFADKSRGIFSYLNGNKGDWKSSKEGADGYKMVAVNGKPYWADAIGISHL